MRSILKLASAFVFLTVLAGCNLPRGAANELEILYDSESEDAGYQVVEVTRANISEIQSWSPTGWHGHYHWPKTTNGASSTIIDIGDMLNVTIWDSQENSLLTSTEERFINIPDVEVDSDGTIFLPYVSKVHVKGLTSGAAREKIQNGLESIVPSAQVQVSLQQGRENSIDVVGGVAAPGSYPMPSRNYKILNVLADAGGIPTSLRNPRVRLIRGSQTYEISAEELYKDGSRNALMRPMDSVVVEEDERSFVAFGASGKEDLIYFPKDVVTALEAVSLMGGLSDSRGDPQGVLVLREFSAQDLQTSEKPGPQLQQVVFTFNLTTADGLFAARNFEIQPSDTVLASESPVTALRTILELIGSAVGVSAQTANLGG